jgi:hypothetical protein
VGRLGTACVASVGIASTLNFQCQAALQGISSGVQVDTLIPDTRHPPPESEPKAFHPKSQIPNPKSEIRNPKSEIRSL